jgi:hypothetical protein
MFTVLADPGGGFRGVPAAGWVGEVGRRQCLVGAGDPRGECCRLFGVGEGPAEAVAGAKQERICVQFFTSIRGQGSHGLVSRWGNPSRSICNTICNSRAPLGYGWASVALRPAYGV